MKADRILQLSLLLFNVVPEGPPAKLRHKDTLPMGIVLDERAAHAQPQILAFFRKKKLSPEQLNATFHKSWEKIETSSRQELWVHQILHYLTTYGALTSSYIYIPNEILELPEKGKMPVRVIQGVPETVIVERALGMLRSGVALEEETLDQVLELLKKLKYEWKSVEGIRNKEALVKLVKQTGILPTQPTEFLRYLVYKATDSSLLIKSNEVLDAIKEKKLMVVPEMEKFGLEKCAEIFHRFKPIWLAFKTNKANIPLINKVARLAKRHHRPLPVDVLNNITAIGFTDAEISAALQKANNFRKIRVLNALNTRLQGAEIFLYRIRNGKAWSKKEEAKGKLVYYQRAYDFIYLDLLESLNLEGKKVRYPQNIDYALPSSEKMFAGAFPFGTKLKGKNLVTGVYWENKWGANDLDLSGLPLQGKIGWNSAYKGSGMLYSGDITDATNGATELLYTKNGEAEPTLVVCNIFSGKVGAKARIIVGQGTDIKENHMFDPRELLLEVDTQMTSRNMILGIVLPEPDGRLSFTLVNASFGNMSVSSPAQPSNYAREALAYQYLNPVSLRQVLQDAGAELVTGEEAVDLDLRPEALGKDTLLNLFLGK